MELRGRWEGGQAGAKPQGAIYARLPIFMRGFMLLLAGK